jgi:hypothetical protein
VPHVDRRSMALERPLDDFDRPLHPGAETARLSEYDAKRAPWHVPFPPFRRTVALTPQIAIVREPC